MLEMVKTAIREAKEAFASSESKLTGLENGANNEFYVPFDIQGSNVVASSDGDGKFKLQLITDKRVAVVARKDGLSWLIWVSPRKGDQILLTEKNLNGNQYESCVFNPSQLSSSLSFIKEAFSSARER
jgi:hypothetical protein